MNANLDRIDQIQACIDVACSVAKESGIRICEEDFQLVAKKIDTGEIIRRYTIWPEPEPATFIYELFRIAFQLCKKYNYSIHECQNGDIDVFNKDENLTEQKEKSKGL